MAKAAANVEMDWMKRPSFSEAPDWIRRPLAVACVDIEPETP